jgi:hypothetical protein
MGIGMHIGRKRDATIAPARPTFLFFLVLLAPLSSGCSLMGYYIGKAIDGDYKEKKYIDNHMVNRIEKGTPVDLHLFDGSEVRGNYQGLVNVSPDWYIGDYEYMLMNSEYGPVMPDIGDTVTVVRFDGTAENGEFVGLGIKGTNGTMNPAIPLTDDLREVKDYYVALKTRNTGTKTQVYLPEVKRIVGQDFDVVDGSTIRQMVRRREIPLMSYVALRTGSETKVFSFYAIRTVSDARGYGGSAKYWGLGIGITVDTLVAVVGVIALYSLYTFGDHGYLDGVCFKDCSY